MGFFQGIFTTIFNSKKNVQISSSKMINLFTPRFSSTVSPLLNDTFMTAVNTHALHFSKIKPTAYLNDKESKNWLTKLLSVRPNAIMSAGVFWEKAARNYYIDNNLFIYLDWDPENTNAPLQSLWILDPNTMEVSYNKALNEFYLSFQLQGDHIVTSLDNIVHVARHVGLSEIFGEHSQAIDQVLKVINTNYEGIDNAIKSSAFLRFVINTTTLLTDADKEKKAKKFAETYLSKDGTGIAYLDSSSEITQINSEAKYANEKEMAFFEKKIMNYLTIDQCMVSAKFTENDFQSYYETNMEPFANKLSSELTYKIFTDREYGVGNRIVISSSDMQVISLTSKISILSNTKEIGLYTINEYRKMFNMPPIEDGDRRSVSLNYINSDIADDYQKNKAKNGGLNDGTKKETEV